MKSVYELASEADLPIERNRINPKLETVGLGWYNIGPAKNGKEVISGPFENEVEAELHNLDNRLVCQLVRVFGDQETWLEYRVSGTNYAIRLDIPTLYNFALDEEIPND